MTPKELVNHAFELLLAQDMAAFAGLWAEDGVLEFEPQIRSRWSVDLQRLHHTVATTHSLHAALTDGFQLAFVVAACIAFAGALVALLALPRVPARPASAAADDAPSVPPAAAAEQRTAVAAE